MAIFKIWQLEMQLPAFVKQFHSQLSSKLQWGLQLQLLTVSWIAINIAFANTSEFAITAAMQFAIRQKVARSRSTSLALCDHKCICFWQRIAIIIAMARRCDASRRLCDRVRKLAHRIAIAIWSAFCHGLSTRCIEILALQFMIQSRQLYSICVELHLYSFRCNCMWHSKYTLELKLQLQLWSGRRWSWKLNWNATKFTINVWNYNHTY